MHNATECVISHTVPYSTNARMKDATTTTTKSEETKKKQNRKSQHRNYIRNKWQRTEELNK